METTTMHPLSESEKTEPVIGRVYFLNLGSGDGPFWLTFKVVSFSGGNCTIIGDRDGAKPHGITWENWTSRGEVMSTVEPLAIVEEVKVPVVLDNTQYTRLRNWRTRPLPSYNDATMEGVSMEKGVSFVVWEAIKMEHNEEIVSSCLVDLLNCDDEDSLVEVDQCCEVLDAMYGWPGRAGLEGVQ